MDIQETALFSSMSLLLILVVILGYIFIWLKIDKGERRNEDDTRMALEDRSR